MEETDTNEFGQAERVRRGDRAAFKALFHTYYDALCNYACRYVDSLEVAEDLVQDVFFDLWKRRRTWRPQHSPKAFLYGAVRNQTLKHRRRSRGHTHVNGQDALREIPSQQNPEQSLRDRELTRVSQQAIDELPERRRHIFILSREHDLTYAEIAVALGISVKTVETQMGRALQHLRERLSRVHS